MEVILISLVGIVVFGGAFLVLCPEWWSTSLGTLKDKKPEKKAMEAGDTRDPKAGS
ncbi:hypothetical protein JRI60_35220 [Archangium violaceum]|uniref:hypothetical protein n=1 Tax=Archangium violaceum TaxID=83451 RepID=UPI00194F56A0|nr:hypothetical protein [Archangium violaceum]QRN94357.1 hypothetical protein JRI60_35220 [Archangium violaceum]